MTEQTTIRDGCGNLAVTLSCKALVREGDTFWLRKNERGDWELPGGRLEDHEQPEEAVVREIREELGCDIEKLRLVDVSIWKKDFGTNTHVGIVTFDCEVVNSTGVFEEVGEAGAVEFKQFSKDEALLLSNLPDVYKRAMKKA